MRIFRNQAQWQVIIENYEASDLSVIDYCLKHQLSTSSFYAARQKIITAPSVFVRTKVTQEVEVIIEQPPIELLVGHAKVILPTTTSATYIGQLLRELV
jgi:hypothetical protein